MRAVLARLLAAWLFATPAFADSSFVAPTATGTATTGQIPGTATNDNANAGNVGEIIDSGVVTITTSLSNGTAVNCTSISLTAGDWDVNGTIGFTGAASTTVQGIAAGISTTTATLPANSSIGLQVLAFSSAQAIFVTRNPAISAGPVRVTVSGTTTVFLVGRLDFGVSTATLSNCQLVGRRRR